MNSTVNNISEITKRVKPLGGKVPDMPIAAIEWNVLVDSLLALLTIESVQQQTSSALLEQRYALREHAHPGAVSFNWLDADLQARIGSGGLNATTQTALSTLTQNVTETRGEVKRLTESNDSLQSAVERFSISDADRAGSVRRLETQFITLADHGPHMERIDGDLRIVNEKLGGVLGLERLLTVNGKPVDLAAMQAAIKAFEDVQKAVGGEDGVLIESRRLERDIRELQDTAGTGTALEARFVALEARLKEALDQRLEQLGHDLETKQTAALQTALDALEARLSERIGNVEKSLTTINKDVEKAVVAVLGPRIDAAVFVTEKNLKERMDDAAGKIRIDFAAADDKLRTDLGKRTDDTDAKIRADFVAADDKLRIDINKRTDDADAKIRADFVAADDKLRTDINKRTDDTDAKIRADFVAADDKLRTDINKRTDDADAKIRADFVAADDKLRIDINKRTDDADAKIRADADLTTKRVDGILTSLQSAFVALSKQAALDLGNAEKRANDRMDAGDAKIRFDLTGDALPTLVANAVRSALANQPEQVRIEVMNQLAALKLDVQLRETMDGMRKDLLQITTTQQVTINSHTDVLGSHTAKLIDHEKRITILQATR